MVKIKSQGRKLSMKKFRDILKLQAKGLSQHQIAELLKISSSTVNKYLRLGMIAGLDYERIKPMSDMQIEALIFPKPTSFNNLTAIDFEHIQKELSRKGVTLKLVHAELVEAHAGNYYSYPSLCRHYKRWAGNKKLTLRQEHKAGEKMWVDFAGQDVPIYDRNSNKILFCAQIYCSSLGVSGLVYCEAITNQRVESFIGAHERNLAYLGGVPHLIVPDNLKSGVTKADRYDPNINDTYEDFAQHYSTVVLPARVRRPQDKAKVEQAVQMVEREVLARLRDKRFYSIGELNAAIRPLMEELNNRPYQRKASNRRQVFNKIDKPVLLALPFSAYELARFYRRTITPDYHVNHEEHYYSVPHEYVGNKVDIRVSETSIEILHGGKRITSHPRSFIEGKTTTHTHMPKRHQKYVDWTIEAGYKWAASIGDETLKAIRILVAKLGEPKSLRAMAGLKSAGKKLGDNKLEQACLVANSNNLHSYKFIKELMQSHIIPIPAPTTRALPVNHENVRGSEYFEDYSNDNSQRQVHHA